MNEAVYRASETRPWRPYRRTTNEHWVRPTVTWTRHRVLAGHPPSLDAPDGLADRSAAYRRRPVEVGARPVDATR